jgi:hypothetical protein
MKKRKRRAQQKRPWGTVYVATGDHKGRIGFYDDDSESGGRIVYFGDMFLDARYFVLRARLRPVTMVDLEKRREAIRREIGLGGDLDLTVNTRAELLDELVLVESEMIDRLWSARFQKPEQRRTVFISHSSRDKKVAHWLAADLVKAGHSPWLDEWQIALENQFRSGSTMRR